MSEASKNLTMLDVTRSAEVRRVEVDVRQVYGTTKYYPANQNAFIFADINGAKTLSRRTLELVKQLGYSVEASKVRLDI